MMRCKHSVRAAVHLAMHFVQISVLFDKYSILCKALCIFYKNITLFQFCQSSLVRKCQRGVLFAVSHC